MNNYEFQGKVKTILPTEKIKEFNKATVILEAIENEKFTHTLAIDGWNDKATQISELKVGDVVKVFFNIKTNQWQKEEETTINYFTSLVAWKIEKI